MAISFLAYVAIFSDSFIFGKATSSQFLRVTFFKVSQELLFRSSSFFRADAFFEELLFQTVTFFQHFFPQNIYLLRAKLLPKNQTLRTGNSLMQLPFRTATHRRHLQKSYFFKADFSAQHQLFQKKVRFWKRLLFQKSKILHYLLFSESYFFNVFFINRYILYPLHFQKSFFLQHAFSEELLFHRYPSFLQLHFLLTYH